MSKYRIETGVVMPQRGPKRKYAGIPLSDMNRGDSVKVAEVLISRRTPTYISVRKAVQADVQMQDLRNEFKVTTKTVGNNKCEVRVWRVR